ncbi:hypothetical protein ACFYU8_17990 [Brevibacillus sp. NPDC003359]|uniref:hypothetical protein n=1 Tax=unclassified Brevibacillus TaxID=2684853 RepID=UPI0036C12F4B
MNLLYEHYYDQMTTALQVIAPDTVADLNVIIYDSVRKDYAINVSWHEDCIRGEWGVVKAIEDRKIKLVRDDGIWWVPIDNLLLVERV